MSNERPENNWRWLVEWVGEGEGFTRCVKKVYFSGSTRHQEVDVVELCGLGKSLVIEGKVQSSIIDEHWYHEALVHPPLLSHNCPRRVLVIGGGEGATLREILRHKCVEKIVMVDLDREIVELAKKHLAEWHQGSFDDPRVEIVFSDGRRFLEKTEPASYDAVILDLVDPLQGTQAVYLYTIQFYRLVRRALRQEGVMVTQATSPTYTPRVFAAINNTISKVFPRTHAYMTFVRSYNGLWGFVAATLGEKGPGDLDPKEIGRRIEERITGGSTALRFYSPETHQWMFTLPLPVRKILEEVDEYSTDENPVSVPI